MYILIKLLSAVVITAIVSQTAFAIQLEGEALRANVIKRLPKLNHTKLEALMQRVGKEVPKGYYQCLCHSYSIMGNGIGYNPNVTEGDCKDAPYPCVGGNWGCTSYPLPSKIIDRCVKNAKYDDNSTIVDAIVGEVESLYEEKKLDDYCIKVNKIPSSGAMKGQGLFDLPNVGDTSVREGTYDIHRNKLPDYWNAWWDRFSKRTGQLWQQGYPKPVKTNLTNYNSLTLEYLEQNVCRISNPCKQAIFIKLFLDANQDDFVPVDFFNTPKEKFAEVGLDIMLTIYVRNEFDITKWGKDKLSDLSKWGQDKLSDPSSKGISPLKVMSKLKNTVNIMQALSKIATGTLGGQVGRWKFAIYDQARKKGWTPERIEQERRRRLEQNDSLLEKIEALNSEMDRKVLLREAQHKKVLEEIDKTLVQDMQEIDADKAVAGATRRRLKQLSDPNFVVPGTAHYRRGVDIADRVSLEEMRERYLADAENDYDRARSGKRMKSVTVKTAEFMSRERDIRMIAKTHNEKISEHLGKMARISAENDVLKRYAIPVAAGECEKLRSIPTDDHK